MAFSEETSAFRSVSADPSEVSHHFHKRKKKKKIHIYEYMDILIPHKELVAFIHSL